MTTQITEVCKLNVVTTLSEVNTVRINNNSLGVSITQPKTEITLVCSQQDYSLIDGIIESFIDVTQVIVNHSLGRKPKVTVIELSGTEVQVSVIHNNDNQFTASWNGLMTGKIIAK